MSDIKSFHADFCVKLEYAICAALEGAEDPAVKGYWCDGVIHAPFFNDQVNRDNL